MTGVRLAGLDDAAALAALHARAFPRGWAAKEITDLMRRGAFGFLADDTALKGFVLAWAPGPEAEILTLVTAPEHRREGWGVQLLAAALAAAQAQGAGAMLLEVADDNDAARALYAATGFVEVGRRLRYYQRESGAADALVLRRELGERSPHAS